MWAGRRACTRCSPSRRPPPAAHALSSLPTPPTCRVGRQRLVVHSALRGSAAPRRSAVVRGAVGRHGAAMQRATRGRVAVGRRRRRDGPRRAAARLAGGVECDGVGPCAAALPAGRRLHRHLSILVPRVGQRGLPSILPAAQLLRPRRCRRRLARRRAQAAASRRGLAATTRCCPQGPAPALPPAAPCGRALRCSAHPLPAGCGCRCGWSGASDRSSRPAARH